MWDEKDCNDCLLISFQRWRMGLNGNYTEQVTRGWQYRHGVWAGARKCILTFFYSILTDQGTNSSTDRWTNRLTNQQTNGPTDWRTDEQTKLLKSWLKTEEQKRMRDYQTDWGGRGGERGRWVGGGREGEKTKQGQHLQVAWETYIMT